MLTRFAALALLLLLVPIGRVSAQADPTLSANRLKQDPGRADQLVVVTSAGWSSTTATLETFERSAGGEWQRAFDPMPAHVGYRGWTVGSQRGENDGSSPTGTFGIGRQSFGLGGNPGVKGSWFDVGPNDWWISDPGSPLYNTHQAGPANGRWDESFGEQLAVAGPVTYQWATFIEFNSPPTAAIGSAVFLHLDKGGPTAGCVALGQSDLLAVLRWLDPARAPVIAMGPSSYLLAPPPTTTTEAPPPTDPPVTAAPRTTTTTVTTTTMSTTTTTTTTLVTSTTAAAAPVVVTDRRAGGAGRSWLLAAGSGGALAATGGVLAWRRRRA